MYTMSSSRILVRTSDGQSVQNWWLDVPKPKSINPPPPQIDPKFRTLTGLIASQTNEHIVFTKLVRRHSVFAPRSKALHVSDHRRSGNRNRLDSIEAAIELVSDALKQGVLIAQVNTLFQDVDVDDADLQSLAKPVQVILTVAVQQP